MKSLRCLEGGMGFKRRGLKEGSYFQPGNFSKFLGIGVEMKSGKWQCH